jgi:Leucine-rich repeat (LRR) protein
MRHRRLSCRQGLSACIILNYDAIITSEEGELPGFVYRLTALRSLSAKSCAVNHVRPDIRTLKALTSLDLSNNGLALLPASLLYLPRLRLLSIAQNPQLRGANEALLHGLEAKGVTVRNH